jgi:RND family efflux transporter MFP subunit
MKGTKPGGRGFPLSRAGGRGGQGVRVLLLALLVLPACKHAQEEVVDTTEAVPVKVARAITGPIHPVIAATGQVKPAAGAELRVVPPQEARIAELPKSVGDRVRRGDLLVRFEIPSLKSEAATERADLARAEAQLATARQAAERLSGLFERGIAARKDLEDARRDLTQAEATVAESRSATTAAAHLAQRAVVRSPFDGVVASRSHEPGDMVDPSGPDPILRVIDPSRLQVEAAVPAVELGPVTVGSPARVRGASYAEEQARVVARPATVDSATGTALVRLDFAAPTHLPSGMAVDVEIDGEEHPAAVLVPADALVQEGPQSFVFVVDGEKKAHRRDVTIGVIAGGKAEILSGVTAGEQVVASGQAALPDGATVEPAQ